MNHGPKKAEFSHSEWSKKGAFSTWAQTGHLLQGHQLRLRIDDSLLGRLLLQKDQALFESLQAMPQLNAPYHTAK
jgi:hypothetical protein